MSYRLTPSSSAHAGSTSRGTAMSIRSSGRASRSRITTSSSSGPTIACGEEVEETMMSACTSCSGSPSSPTTEPPKRSARLSARSACRLATKIVPAPCDASARAVNSLVSPAPMMTTLRSRSPPTMLSARSTATDGTLTRLAPIAVSERTRLPVLSAAANRRFDRGPVQPASMAAAWARRTWPWTSASPTIIESRPAVTRYSWRAASQLRGE